MTESTEESRKKSSQTAYFMALFLGALFVMFGDSYLESAAKPEPGDVKTGTLIDTKTSRAYRSIRPETYLVIESRYGKKQKYEVNSSWRLGETDHIRKRASALIGQEVIYKVDGIGRLLEARTVDGVEIVTRTHTIEAKIFTGWSMAIGGLGVMIASVLGLVHHERKKK